MNRHEQALLKAQSTVEKNNSAVILFLHFFRNIGLECYPIGIGLLSISVLVIFNDNTCAEDFGNIENSLECLTGAAENCIACLLYTSRCV